MCDLLIESNHERIVLNALNSLEDVSIKRNERRREEGEEGRENIEKRMKEELHLQINREPKNRETFVEVSIFVICSKEEDERGE
jgi:hypothetical protein